MLKRFAIFMLLGFFSALAGSAAFGQVAPPPAVVPAPPPVIKVQPAWTPVPGVPGIVYAPKLGQDLFRYQNNYYCWHDGRWYQGANYGGPWNVIQSPPSVFTQIAPKYYKRPPGWDHGKKTGWGGAPMPPGQMKKQQPAMAPVAAPSGSGTVVQPVEQAGKGKGKKAKGGSPGQVKHGGGDDVVPVDAGGQGQGGPPGKGKGKFK